MDSATNSGLSDYEYPWYQIRDQFQFTPPTTTAQTYNYQFFNSYNQAGPFTNFNHATMPTSEASALMEPSPAATTTTTTATGPSMLQSILSQKSPSVFTELSELKQYVLSVEQKLKISSEECEKLEVKVKELQTTIWAKDNKNMELEVENIITKGKLVREECKTQTLSFQIEQLQRKMGVKGMDELNTASASTSTSTSTSSTSTSSQVLEGIGKDHLLHGVSAISFGQDQICLCGARFSQKGNLISHILQKVKQGGKFPCSVCDKRFDGTGTLRAHTRRVHKYNLHFSVGCRYCGKVFETHLQLHQHRKSEHGNPNSTGIAGILSPLKMKVSKKPAKSVAKPEPQHEFKGLKWHPTDDVEIIICRCDKEFIDMKALDRHIRAMENNNFFSRLKPPSFAKGGMSSGFNLLF